MKKTKTNALGLTPTEVTAMVEALSPALIENTIGDLDFPYEATVAWTDITTTVVVREMMYTERIIDYFKKPNYTTVLRGGMRWSKLPEYQGLAISTEQTDKKEAARLTSLVHNLGFTNRAYLYPYEVSTRDFVRYAQLGDFDTTVGRNPIAIFKGKIAPQGDLIRLHYLLVKAAWDRGEAIALACYMQFPTLHSSNLRYGYYRHGNLNIVEGYSAETTHVKNYPVIVPELPEIEPFVWTISQD